MAPTGRSIHPLLLTPFGAWSGHLTLEGLVGDCASASNLQGPPNPTPHINICPFPQGEKLLSKSLLWISLYPPTPAGHTLVTIPVTHGQHYTV